MTENGKNKGIGIKGVTERKDTRMARKYGEIHRCKTGG